MGLVSAASGQCCTRCAPERLSLGVPALGPLSLQAAHHHKGLSFPKAFIGGRRISPLPCALRPCPPSGSRPKSCPAAAARRSPLLQSQSGKSSALGPATAAKERFCVHHAREAAAPGAPRTPAGLLSSHLHPSVPIPSLLPFLLPRSTREEMGHWARRPQALQEPAAFKGVLACQGAQAEPGCGAGTVCACLAHLPVHPGRRGRGWGRGGKERRRCSCHYVPAPSMSRRWPGTGQRSVVTMKGFISHL